MKTIVETYRDKNKKHRWRMIRAGRIVADSGEGYSRKITMRRSLLRLIESLQLLKYRFK